MNNVIEQLTAHTSVRKYTEQPIDAATIQAILQATQQAPSWINGQQMSIIRITDKAKREKAQQLAGNQAYVGTAPEFWVFCLDFHRTAIAAQLENKSFDPTSNLDTIIVGTTDVGIALGTAVIAAESFGLGTVAIGGVRRHAEQMSELLELPPYVYPVSGLCIGYPAEQPLLKPRLPQEAVVFENAYNASLETVIAEYNDTISDYMRRRSNGEQSSNWTSGVANFYSSGYENYSNAKQTLSAQQLYK